MASACLANLSYKYKVKNVLNNNPNAHPIERLYIYGSPTSYESLKIKNTATIDVEKIIKNNSQYVGLKKKFLSLNLKLIIFTIKNASIFGAIHCGESFYIIRREEMEGALQAERQKPSGHPAHFRLCPEAEPKAWSGFPAGKGGLYPSGRHH